MAFTKGKDLRLKFGDKFLLHATSCSLSFSTDTEEITTKDTVGKELVLGDQSYTLSTSALVATLPDGNTTHVVKSYLINAWKNKTLIAWEFTDGEVGNDIYSGNCYVTGGELTADNGSIANTSFSLTGTGEFVIGVID
jgi:predicted secreted protein